MNFTKIRAKILVEIKNLTYLLSAAYVAAFIFIAFFFTRCSEEEIVPDGADVAFEPNAEPTNHEPSAGHINAPIADPQPSLGLLNRHTPPLMGAWEALEVISSENPLVQRVFEALRQQEDQMRSAVAQGIDFRLLHIRDIRHLHIRDQDWVYIPFTGHRNGYQLVLVAHLPADRRIPVQIYLQETTLLEQIEEGEAYHLQYYSLDMTAVRQHTTSPSFHNSVSESGGESEPLRLFYQPIPNFGQPSGEEGNGGGGGGRMPTIVLPPLVITAPRYRPPTYFHFPRFWNFGGGGGNSGGGGYSGSGGGGYSGSGGIGSSSGGSSQSNSNLPLIPIQQIQQRLENQIRHVQNSEERRRLQLEYIRDLGGSEGRSFRALVTNLLATPDLTVGDVSDINDMVNTTYSRLKANYMMAIFSPSNVGAILALALNPGTSVALRNSLFRLVPRYSSIPSIERGYSSHQAFVRANGPAGTGMQWHHIVERTPSNLARFGATQIHNTKNLVRVPSNIHTGRGSISAYYSSKPRIASGQTVRQWLSTQSYQEQMRFGLNILNRAKQGLPFPP